MATSKVRRSIDFSYGTSGGPTAQLCHKRILNIIATHSSSIQLIQPSETNKLDLEEKSSVRSLCCAKRGFDIDLNLRLGPALDSEPNRTEHQGLSDCSSVGEAICADAKETVHSSGDFSTIEPHKGEESESEPEEEEETKEFSEITNLQVQTPETDEIEEIGDAEKVRRSEGYLDLLVEAARLVSGNFEEEEDRPIQSGRTREEYRKRKRKRSQWRRLELCEEGFEDISPVVRSKRGRNQVLPYRYRDSVLEPLKRLCTSTKQRSSSPRVSAKPRPK